MKALLMSLLFIIGWINPPVDKVSERFKAPDNYHVIRAAGFGGWLGNLPLKPIGSSTRTYRGDIARTDAYTAAVIDMSVGKQDLQQCADAVMRLRAEYLFYQKKYDVISFNFTSGFKCDYTHYAKGYRYSNGRWVLKSPISDYSYKNFLNYLNLVFSYAGTISLEKELVKINNGNRKAGDIFIHGGSPGHCFIILAVAENAAHQQKFIIAQSFMPAQDIQVLKAPGHDAWFSLAETPNIPYGELIQSKYLRRFTD